MVFTDFSTMNPLLKSCHFLQKPPITLLGTPLTSSPYVQGSNGDVSSDLKRRMPLPSQPGSASEHHQLQPCINISLFILWKEFSLPSETWQIWSPIRWIYVRKVHQALLNTKRQSSKSWKDRSTILFLSCLHFIHLVLALPVTQK